MANTLSQVKSVLVDISGTLQLEGGLTLNANSALNQLVALISLFAPIQSSTRNERNNLNGF